MRRKKIDRNHEITFHRVTSTDIVTYSLQNLTLVDICSRQVATKAKPDQIKNVY